MHPYCFTRYKVRNTRCPSCSEDWAAEANAKRLKPIGESAARSDDAQRRRRAPTSEASDREEESEPEEEGQNEQVKVEKQTQSNGTQAKRRSNRASTSTADRWVQCLSLAFHDVRYS
jgi:hypothetical protein